MEVLYIPQLDDVSTDGDTSGAAARYRLLKKIPEDGRVGVTDRAVTRVEASVGDPLTFVFPPKVKGLVRDFFVRIVLTCEEAPEITFVGANGEVLSFEAIEQNVLSCEIGINMFSFTETDEGIFMVNRKQIDIDQEVEFDPCGGTVAKTKYEFKLGAMYGSLPTPVLTGMVFQGWFTEAEGGVQVKDSDRCKTSITKLYAQWAEYVDPFVDDICPAKNLTFHTSGDVDWYLEPDSGKSYSAPASARSGVISDNGRTSLTTTVIGPGRLSFAWNVSSENNYDYLRFIVDGNEESAISGEGRWATHEIVLGEGTHTIEWAYTKDGSATSGSDCGWVDDVVWTPEGGS